MIGTTLETITGSKPMNTAIESHNIPADPKPTILIIDDDWTNSALLSAYLAQHGFDVLTARDSRSGLERARLGQPDLIFLDVFLPDLDGFETCRCLKADPATQEIPVIFITALADDTYQKVTGFQVGGVDYLTKPLQAAEVVARLTTHLSLRTLTRQLQQQTRVLEQEISERKWAQAELQQYRDQLEALVQTRTHDLQKTNEQLHQEITERRHAEVALQQLILVVENSPVVLFRWRATENWPVELVSQNIAQFGYTPDELLSGKILYSTIVHPDDLERVVREVEFYTASGIDRFQQEYRIVTKEGQVRWIDDRTMIEREAEGRVSHYQGILVDITARKQAEEQLKASLQEKEVLLKEIHHRVKNNLQVVSSLLDLQADYITDEPAHLILQESQNRIKSMALIHERLYRSNDLARINFAEYVEDLIHHLLRSYGNLTGRVSLQHYIAPVSLSIETAIPCGLIINELVSNALKYAFPQGRAGVIEVELQVSDQRQLLLTVKDNGIGLPTGIDFRRVKSLGLTLVMTLVKQLKGNIEFHSQSGTEFEIAFTDPNIVS
jgi:PAS domain S-box-containing protein